MILYPWEMAHKKVSRKSFPNNMKSPAGPRRRVRAGYTPWMRGLYAGWNLARSLPRPLDTEVEAPAMRDSRGRAQRRPARIPSLLNGSARTGDMHATTVVADDIFINFINQVG